MSIHVRLPAVDGVGFASFARGSPPAMPTLRPETFGLSAPGQGSGSVDAGPPESIEKSMEASEASNSNLSSSFVYALRCSSMLCSFSVFALCKLSPLFSKSFQISLFATSFAKSFQVFPRSLLEDKSSNSFKSQVPVLCTDFTGPDNVTFRH